MTAVHNSLHIVVLTGPGGSGKTTALRTLEDLGFYCVDNLPIVLLDQFLELCRGQDDSLPIALVIDTRERHFFAEAPATLQRLVEAGESIEVVFLDSDDKTLLRRYSETRRRHPLAGADGNVRDGLLAERTLLEPLRNMAHALIDTGSLSVHDLKRVVGQRYGASTDAVGTTVTAMSFGFKHGVPVEADLLFDVRFLKNPYFEASLRGMRGVDAPVAEYVFADGDADTLLGKIDDLLEFLLPRYEKEGKRYLTVAIGCTGGHHRSVAMTEALAARFSERERTLRVVHRDISR